ncbi:MAG: hypothetical protein K8L97_26935 [Anaerolineae bacterium]|nr:hypothetical protein [Anaerolineae bacterium]
MSVVSYELPVSRKIRGNGGGGGDGGVAKKDLAAKKPLAFSHQPLGNTEACASLLCRKCRANDNR